MFLDWVKQLTLKNMGLNYMDPLICGFFSINMYYKNEQSMLFESLDVELWIESEVK